MKYPFNPEAMFTPELFEIFILLVLRDLYPGHVVSRIKSPDGGIDVLRENGSHKYVYQCKHFPRPKLSEIRRKIGKSMIDACKTREEMKWETITLCISGDLTMRQRKEIAKIAGELGLKIDEYAIWAGIYFYPILQKKPYLWEQTCLPTFDIGEETPLDPTQKIIFHDGKLEKIIKKIDRRGDKTYFSKLLEEHGVTRINSLNDFYHIAMPFYKSTKSVLRMMSFDTEIKSFWLSDSGEEYLKMNKALIDRGVELKRIFVFDFESLQKNISILNTYLFICLNHEKLGIKCKIIDSNYFSEKINYHCKIFGTQDDENVVLYAPYDFQVSFLRDKNFVKEAIEVYDAIFASRVSHTPKRLWEKHIMRN